jgi:hypothetical protein
MKRAALLMKMLIAIAVPASAGWVQDGVDPFPGPGTDFYENVVMAPSGKDVIVAGVVLSSDSEGNTITNIRLQKLDRCGDIQWGSGGVFADPVPGGVGIYEGLSMIPDGSLGCIVAWRTQSSPGDIRAQRFDKDGNPLWAAGGVGVATTPDNETDPHMVSDGAGGAVIAWERGGDVHAQRVDAAGVAQWAAGGIPVTADPAAIVLAGIAEGAPGEAVVLYHTAGGGYEYFVQKLTPAGAPAWVAGGLSLGNTANDQSDITIDGAGGVWVALVAQDGGDTDIETVHVNAAGTIVETNLHGGADDHHSPHIAYVGNGNVDVAYNENLGGVHNDIHIRRIGAGIVYAVTYLPGDQNVADLAWDGMSGSVLVWTDVAAGYDIYVDHFTGSSLNWLNLGQPLCTASGIQQNPRVVLSPNALMSVGDFFVAWNDGRGDPAAYVERVDGATGIPGHPEPKIQAVLECDGSDEGGCLRIEWIKSQLDGPFPPLPPIEKYSVWRAVDALPMYPPDPIHSCVTPTSRPGATAPVCDGWEKVLEVPGGLQGSVYYQALATTRDAAPGDEAVHYWVVMAHDSLDSTYVSEPDSGASHDEIAPSHPVEPYGEYRGNWVYLQWLSSTAPDVSYYNVYRLGNGQSLFVGSTAGNDYTDDTVDPTQSYDYEITAVDDNGNEGPPSPTVGVNANPTGARPRGAAPGALTLMNASPNPFSDHASLRVGLPADAAVTVEIFDARGRRVLMQQHENLGAGWHTLRLDVRGNANLPSGVYFYRVTAGGESAVRKLVLTR